MEIILLAGLQGSGKSTYYRTHYAATHVLVSKDSFRNNVSGQWNHASCAWNRCFQNHHRAACRCPAQLTVPRRSLTADTVTGDRVPVALTLASMIVWVLALTQYFTAPDVHT
jgi:hypothetical protein